MTSPKTTMGQEPTCIQEMEIHKGPKLGAKSSEEATTTTIASIANYMAHMGMISAPARS